MLLKVVIKQQDFKGLADKMITIRISDTEKSSIDTQEKNKTP